MSNLFKIVEKIIYLRLRWYIESHKILPSFQFGFRPNKSCIDALVTLNSFIQANFIDKKKIICVFIDICGAFDNVNPNLLLHDLRNADIPAHTRKFIANTILERNYYFVLDGHLKGSLCLVKVPPKVYLSAQFSLNYICGTSGHVLTTIYTFYNMLTSLSS